MGKNKAVKFKEEYLAKEEKLQEMSKNILEKENKDIHIDDKEYEDFYKVLMEVIFCNECMIKYFYNDFVSKKEKIDLEEFRGKTQDEEQEIAKVREKYSEYRGYMESDIYRLNKCIQKIRYLVDNDKLHVNEKTIAKYRKRIKLETVGQAVEASVETVFKKAIIPAFSKGAKLAKSGYYAGMDELGKKADIVYDNFYKEMKAKPTSTLLDYYNNRDLNDNQIAIIEEVLNERGAL
ncbi:hypothetical protein [Staphylococcus xylosus]